MGALALVHAAQRPSDPDAAKGSQADSLRTEKANSDEENVTCLEKQHRAAALDRVLRTKRGAVLDAAAALNVSETRVRHLRNGVGVLTLTKIRKLPDYLRAPLLALLAAPVTSAPESDTHGPFQEAA